MPSLLDKVNAQEAKQVAKKAQLPKPTPAPEEIKKEPAVNKITHNSSQKDKQISAKVNDETYKMFTQINKAQGLSNNSALNMIINKYVRENKGILDELKQL